MAKEIDPRVKWREFFSRKVKTHSTSVGEAVIMDTETIMIYSLTKGPPPVIDIHGNKTEYQNALYTSGGSPHDP